MRRFLLFLLLILIVTLSFSQTPQMWTNIRNSAYTIDDSIYIRCETANNLVNTKMYYSTLQGWGESNLQNISGVTFQSSAYFDNQNSLYVRYRSIVDTFVIMQTPYVAQDIPTPNYQKLGFVVEDDENDTTLPIECLDIKNTYFGASDTRLYVGLENFIQDYPSNNGGYVPTEFYFYIGGIVNPETAWQDTIMYALVFAEVPMLLDSGLYKVHGTTFSTDTIQKIADIEYDNSGEGLVMSCNLEDLVSDPDFGNWPNMSNSLGFTFLTVRSGLSGTIQIVDYSKTSQQIFQQTEIEPFENHIPQISQANAITGVTNTNIAATYTDEDNNFPLIAKAVVHHSNEEEDTEYQLTSSGFDYSSGVNFIAQIPETEWESIDIVFSDNNSDFTQETIYPMSSENDVISSNEFVNVYPNPFNLSSQKNVISFDYDKTVYKNAKIKIYNIKGEKIDEIYPDNSQKIYWNVKGKIKSGVYLYKIESDNKAAYGKICVIK